MFLVDIDHFSFKTVSFGATHTHTHKIRNIHMFRSITNDNYEHSDLTLFNFRKFHWDEREKI